MNKMDRDLLFIHCRGYDSDCFLRYQMILVWKLGKVWDREFFHIQEEFVTRLGGTNQMVRISH